MKYPLFLLVAFFAASCQKISEEPFTEAIIGKWTVKGLDYPEIEESKMQITFEEGNALTYHLKADTYVELKGFYQFNNDILFLSNDKASLIFELPLKAQYSSKIEFENEVVFK